MILGIDPGVGKSTGIALVSNGKLFYHVTMRGNDSLDHVVNLHKIYRFDRAVVERPRSAVVYGRHMVKSNSIKQMSGVIKLAMNVGMNIKLTDDLCERLRSVGVKVVDPHPQRGLTKWAGEHWRRVFGYEKKRLPSSHARDAAVSASRWENWPGWLIKNVSQGR